MKFEFNLNFSSQCSILRKDRNIPYYYCYYYYYSCCWCYSLPWPYELWPLHWKLTCWHGSPGRDGRCLKRWRHTLSPS